MSRKSVGLVVNPTQQGWKITEMDDIGNEYDILFGEGEFPHVSNGNGSSIIVRRDVNIKYLYDTSKGYGCGSLRGI